MTDRLKPCPFCGGEAVIREHMGSLYIRPIHKGNCVMRPDTWLLSSKPHKKQTLLVKKLNVLGKGYVLIVM